jgi:hypothetical protein
MPCQYLWFIISEQNGHIWETMTCFLSDASFSIALMRETVFQECRTFVCIHLLHSTPFVITGIYTANPIIQYHFPVYFTYEFDIF